MSVRRSSRQTTQFGTTYPFFCLPLPRSAWLSAEPAALLDTLLVRLSVSVFEAAVAAFFPVVSFADLCCVRALPAALLDRSPVLLERRTFDAEVAAFLLVCLDFAMAGFSIIGSEAPQSVGGFSYCIDPREPAGELHATGSGEWGASRVPLSRR